MTNELVKKLVKVYEKVDHVEKSGKNKIQGYRYVRAADLLHAIRNALQELSIYAQVTFTTERSYTIPRAEGKVPMTAVDVRADVVFHDAESGQTIASSGLGSGADMGDKAIYKAQTGALKYALRNAFLVPDDTDPEADESVDYDENEPPSQRQSDSRPVRKETAPKKTAEPPAEPKKPPRAEIPTELLGPSQKALEMAPSEDSGAPDGIPTEEELKPYRERFNAMVDKLATAGLKASRGIPINRKVLMYLLQTVEQTDISKVTHGQWATFFQVVNGVATSEGGMERLVDLVNTASLKKEEKKP